MKSYLYRFIPCVFALATLVVGGCASTGPAPVDDRNLDGPTRAAAPTRDLPRPASQQPGGSYKVQKGDTLYSIAFRHGVDFRELAGWNNIAPPYTIFVGQDLRLGGRAAPPVRSGVTTNAPPPKAMAATPPPAAGAARPGMPTPAPFENVDDRAAPATRAPPPQAATPPATAVAPNAAPMTAPSQPPPLPTPTPTATPAPTSPSGATGDIAWRWPADGQVTGGFVGGDQTRQGIDIAGKAGDPVRAAADGSVVYSGNGLIGYGELIIVKHSPGFLSAYGHNRKRLVKEGDRVTAGQVIAEMGSSSASRDSLHFEIRKNGKPANPVDYLPRR